MKRRITLVTVCLKCILVVAAIRPIPNRPLRSYVRLGDINIGAFMAITEYAQHELCGQRIRFPLLQQYVEAIVYTIDEINRNRTLLPNITLGYVILDDCVKESTAVAQALRFLPRNDNKHCLSKHLENSFLQDDHYDVVGVIGPQRSENSIAVSYVLGPAKIPQISFFSTSDELSNKELHSNFLRVIPPDKYQVEAIFKFIISQGWTYISAVYSAGSYGEFAYNNVKRLAAKFDICIATQRKTTLAMAIEDYMDILGELMKYPRARVVIAFLGGDEMVGLFEAIYKLNMTSMFIWVGSDGWAERLTMLPSKYKSVLYGSFTSLIDAPQVPHFNEYFQNLNPSTTNNPWFRDFWEWSNDCSFAEDTCKHIKNLKNSVRFHPLALVSKVMDSVYTYANAIQQLLMNECPSTSGKEARDCIRGEILFEFLKNVSFQGYSGEVRFDDSGNMVGNYVISQILPATNDGTFQRLPVMFINAENLTTTQLGNITWRYLKKTNVEEYPSGSKIPIHPLAKYDATTPVSVCSRLCNVGEYIIYNSIHQKCCWECKSCRASEIVIQNRTNCHECDMFFWPNILTNLTTCESITPSFPAYKDGIAIFEITSSLLGIITSVVVLFAYYYFKEASVIKAASLELSFLQLLAILLGFVTMLLYVTPPTHVSCALAYWMFCFSLNLLYAPLLVKAIRIYRIFHAAAQGTRGLKLISPFSQVLISCFIVMGQVGYCLNRSESGLTQQSPISSEYIRKKNTLSACLCF